MSSLSMKHRSCSFHQRQQQYRCVGKSSFAAIVSKCRQTSLFHATETLIQARSLAPSLLTAAENASFPVRMLRYHYRSRHPALIDPSNRLFYNARLRIVPSPLPVDRYGVKFHKVDGLYDPDSGTNLVEGKRIVDALRRCIAEMKNANTNGRRIHYRWASLR